MIDGSIASRLALGLAALLMGLFTHTVVVADSGQDVEKLLREIRQDHPLPALAFLRQTTSINADRASYQGRYQGIEVSVETHPNSTRVASILLAIEGADQIRAILPAVVRVLGPPQTSDRRQGIYGWSGPGYRTASVHKAPSGDSGGNGTTIVSIFYR
ncbi:MAG: hypothetical protein M9919_14585 [Burkholderiaceae bacterium]|jgi:hypothetical protein|nr:hypothetical protein [Burkholderiaceae bacterium]MCO5105219.1 hypothetical protein [Burkholderiaceae bacterium]